MNRIIVFTLILALLVSLNCSAAISSYSASAFAGQDLHLSGSQVTYHQLSPSKNVLVFSGAFEMSIGDNNFSSTHAVVWLDSTPASQTSNNLIDYKATVYLKDSVNVIKGQRSRMTDLSQFIIENGYSMFVNFDVTGEVFVTAEIKKDSDPTQTPLYQEAQKAMPDFGPEFYIRPEAQLPQWPPQLSEPEILTKPSKSPGFSQNLARQERQIKQTTRSKTPRPEFRYPVNISPAGQTDPKIDSAKAPDGTFIDTVIGRIYVWQKIDDEGTLIELLADNAVVYRAAGTEDKLDTAESLSGGPVKAVYMSGDVIVTEGQRTLRADEIYYDFDNRQALAVNASMRTFDAKRNIPIYVRAAKLRQVAQNKFAAENVILTTSEFYQPQISVTASTIVVTDNTSLDAQLEKLSEASYSAEMRDVRFKLGDNTILRLPRMASDMVRPDVPIKKLRIGNSSTYGTSLETQWYFSRLLGLQETPGVESTLSLDYFSKRGVGTGAQIEYNKEDFFGYINGYVIHDSGEDRLGRDDFRKDIEPPRKLRGRFNFQHRHYLPYNWQLSAGVDYSSDEYFVEQFYRGQYNSGASRDTYLHLKRLQDNWALAFLAKARINDFEDTLEELPSAQHHLTGQSLFDDRFTLYSDTDVARLRQRVGNDHSIALNENDYTFASHRSELDMPLRSGPYRLVPFVAGTFGYDDRSGFQRTLVDGTNTGAFGEDSVWIGELGVRTSTQFWKLYPNVKSQLWDINQIRHIVNPGVVAVMYEENDDVVKNRDIVNFSLSQRLQTKRGPENDRRIVDWMRLDTDFVWVNDAADEAGSPQRITWNKPFVPMRVYSAPEIFNGDFSSSLQRYESWGPTRNYFSSDYIWRLSDTAAILSDVYYDLEDGKIDQLNVGYTRLCWPNLSYYIGSRYLRNVEVLDEKGSNAFTFAATYIIDPRYSVVFAQQFDFDYSANIRSDITLIRKYHRIACGFTYSADGSLDDQAIVFSIWPQGVPELAVGGRSYSVMGGAAGY